MTDFPAPDALPVEKAMHAREGVAAAHDRCGHGEEGHAVLTSDLAAGMMPSGRFGANAASARWRSTHSRWCACGHRLHHREWRWVRMKRIRAVWIHLVARLTRHGRQTMRGLGGDGG